MGLCEVVNNSVMGVRSMSLISDYSKLLVRGIIVQVCDSYLICLGTPTVNASKDTSSQIHCFVKWCVTPLRMNVPLVCCWSKVNVWQIRPLTVWSSLKTQEASFDHLTVILRGKTPRGDKERCNRWLYTLSVNYGVLTFQMRGLLPKIMFFKSYYKSDVCQHFFFKVNTHKLYTWFCAQTSRGQSSQDHYPQVQRRIKLSWRSYRLFSIDSDLLHGDLRRIFVSTWFFSKGFGETND